MLLKNFLTWALLCLVLTMAASCSFKSNQKSQNAVATQTNELKIDPLGDSD